MNFRKMWEKETGYHSKTASSFQKKVNWYRLLINRYRLKIKVLKMQSDQYNMLVKFLMDEDRLTKDEISAFLVKRKTIRESLMATHPDFINIKNERSVRI